MKKRIWELDALRGICIIGMVIVHFMYDLVELYGILDWQYPTWFTTVWKCGSITFVVLSGLCVTLGSRSLRRGLIVLACGMIVTAVTFGMYKLEFATVDIIIYFGVLQCLGCCMILWPVFKKLPWWILAPLGAVIVALGAWADAQPGLETMWLMPLGLPWEGFSSSDYFPLLPNLGYFLLGAALGRTVYGKKETLMPKINEKNAVLRFFCFCGRHSLWIYLLHQPVLNGICLLLML